MTHDPSQESLFSLDAFALAMNIRISGFTHCTVNFKPGKLEWCLKERFRCQSDIFADLGLLVKMPKSLQQRLRCGEKSSEAEVPETVVL